MDNHVSNQTISAFSLVDTHQSYNNSICRTERWLVEIIERALSIGILSHALSSTEMNRSWAVGVP